MTKVIYLLAIFFSLFLAQLCLAEMYQYTNNEGVVCFTDNPQKVPAKFIEKSKKETPSSLSTNEPNMTKKKLRYLNDGYSEEYEEPNQTIDSRLSTPEGALELFLSSTRTGNLIDSKASVTGWFWHWYSASSEQSIKKDLLFQNERISGQIITKSEQDEYCAIFKTKRDNSPIVGTIEVINLFGNWKVNRLH